MNSYPIVTNALFFIKPNQVLNVEKCTSLQGYLLSFSKEYIGIDDESCDAECLGKLLRFFSKELVSLAQETMVDLEETLQKMLSEQNTYNLYKSELMKRYFKILLIYIFRQSEECVEAGLQNRNLALVEKFMSLLEKGYIEKKMVADYALELYVSANYLNQIVKKITGNSAGWHIRGRIILEAKRKAVYSNRSMKEIGYMLGFEDPAHFSKLFKKTTGITFVTFKQNMVALPLV
jgi:AraC family transcriptional regulator, transcriptional activator of pobA